MNRAQGRRSSSDHLWALFESKNLFLFPFFFFPSPTFLSLLFWFSLFYRRLFNLSNSHLHSLSIGHEAFTLWSPSDSFAAFSHQLVQDSSRLWIKIVVYEKPKGQLGKHCRRYRRIDGFDFGKLKRLVTFERIQAHPSWVRVTKSLANFRWLLILLFISLFFILSLSRHRG